MDSIIPSEDDIQIIIYSVSWNGKSQKYLIEKTEKEFYFTLFAPNKHRFSSGGKYSRYFSFISICLNPFDLIHF